MIALTSRPARRVWNTVSFPSTLYLVPILDLLLAEIPSPWQAELRLGLQEALVNAAKHGNALDPRKKVFVRFLISSNQYWWIISDQGCGFRPPQCCGLYKAEHTHEERECGRGLYILHQIFDEVEWNEKGTELRLCKQMRSSEKSPAVV
ncbi:MAG TPA: anti-sigma regulatory factor [Leptolyngbyaceae cyanobacterium M33_DOE_097]|uniref:Anti-sigma regulatory factor n=1 Tax=Oscillatoriales cyanobacterium SpSt-418 TaxID=2282169 RepID=A0A7C3PK96_9CYAN|nr:anti-sigma regulatory factor [Leptolyngbyaceae cyanobacterium M33_DOE_097]